VKITLLAHCNTVCSRVSGLWAAEHRTSGWLDVHQKRFES
jgi:hypothetical protein